MGFNVNIYNVILFNLGWLVCVTGGNTVAAFTVTAITWIHMQHISGERGEWYWLLAITLFGVLYDTGLFTLGVLAYAVESRNQAAGPLPPLWMVCLWWLFATTLCHSMQWFRQRIVLAVFFGAVGGSLAYLGGTNLSTVAIGQPEISSLLMIALSWAVIFPLLVLAASRYRQRYVYAGQGQN